LMLKPLILLALHVVLWLGGPYVAPIPAAAGDEVRVSYGYSTKICRTASGSWSGQYLCIVDPSDDFSGTSRISQYKQGSLQWSRVFPFVLYHVVINNDGYAVGCGFELISLGDLSRPSDLVRRLCVVCIDAKGEYTITSRLERKYGALVGSGPYPVIHGLRLTSLGIIEVDVSTCDNDGQIISDKLSYAVPEAKQKDKCGGVSALGTIQEQVPLSIRVSFSALVAYCQVERRVQTDNSIVSTPALHILNCAGECVYYQSLGALSG